MRRVNSRDVARLAGVSQSTVSRVLNNNISEQIPISKETIERVTQAAAELGYEPNLAARSLRTSQTMMIGVLFDDIVSTLSFAILDGIYSTLHNAGFHMLLQSSGHREDRTEDNIAQDREIMRWFHAQRVEGIIIVDSRANDALAEDNLSTNGPPMIFVNRFWSADPPHAFVYPDDRGGGYLATRHLIDLGHRQIAYINGPPERCSCGPNRHLGFQDAMDEGGLPILPEWQVAGGWTAESGYAAGKRILAGPQRPTAIFAANDYMAIGCIRAAEDAGLRVPADLAVVGFDNRDAATYIEPALTTVTLPGDEMGKRAATLMIDAVREENIPVGGTRIPSSLIVRNSCGSAATPRGTWVHGR